MTLSQGWRLILLRAVMVLHLWPWYAVNPSGIQGRRYLGTTLCMWADGTEGACDDYYDPRQPWRIK